MAEPANQQFRAERSHLSGLTCQPCSGDNKTLEAAGFCVDCAEFLCDECFRYHLKPPLTRNHKLLDIDEAKKDTNLAKYRDVCTEKCSQHTNEIIKYFCSDHSFLGCVACMTVNHKNCPGVNYIADIAEETANGDEYSQLIQELDTVLQKTKTLVNTSTENKGKSKASYDKVLEDMKQMKKDVMEAFDNMEIAMQSEAEAITQKDTQKMDEHISIFEKIQKKADMLVANLKNMIDNGQYCKLFTTMKKEKDHMKTMDNQVDTAANDNDVADYCFQPSKQLEEFVKYKDRLGKLILSGNVKSKAAKAREILIKSGKDGDTCSIQGLVSLSRGRLVAADCTNKKVKLVNVKKAKVISELKLPGSPRDITATNDTDELVVTLGPERKLLFIKIRGDTLLKDKEIKTSGWCFGVASAMDKLVVSLQPPERLEILDKNGQVLREIVQDQQGNKLFSSVWSITTASHDMDTIYVPDRSKNTVTCLSLSGKVKAVYEDNDLKAASCVAVDQKGVVYVGGTGSKNIHQITKDCKKISTLLTHRNGIDELRSLCYNTEADCLYVGQYKDKIMAYQMS